MSTINYITCPMCKGKGKIKDNRYCEECGVLLDQDEEFLCVSCSVRVYDWFKAHVRRELGKGYELKVKGSHE